MKNCKVCLEPQHCDCLCSTCQAARDAMRAPLTDSRPRMQAEPIPGWTRDKNDEPDRTF